MEERIVRLKRLREAAREQRLMDKVLWADILIKECLNKMAERASNRFVNQKGKGTVDYLGKSM